ncbi:MAG: hypothetical protein ACRETO_01175 [Gammaproteobacteria bacterium]
MSELILPDGLLTTEEYRLLAAVPLQAAAEIAAQRGDPQLFNDMPTMLALLAMVTALTHAYLNRSSVFPQRSPDPALEAAPVAVCALVFSESNLEPSEVETCLRALSSAYLQLLRQGVLGPQEAYVEKAFESLLAGKRVTALQSLKQAAYAMTGAIDAWEAKQLSGIS